MRILIRSGCAEDRRSVRLVWTATHLSERLLHFLFEFTRQNNDEVRYFYIKLIYTFLMVKEHHLILDIVGHAGRGIAIGPGLILGHIIVVSAKKVLFLDVVASWATTSSLAARMLPDICVPCIQTLMQPMLFCYIRYHIVHTMLRSSYYNNAAAPVLFNNYIPAHALFVPLWYSKPLCRSLNIHFPTVDFGFKPTSYYQQWFEAYSWQSIVVWDLVAYGSARSSVR